MDNDGDNFFTCDNDCDDGNNAVFPGNTEVCDSFDNDCDGVADWGNTAVSIDPNSSDYLTIPVFVPSGSSFTIEAWVFATGFPGSSNTVLHKSDGSGGNDVLLEADNGSTWSSTFNLGGEETLGSASSTQVGQWVHLAATYDGSNYHLYVNAGPENNISNSVGLTLNPNSGPWFIGAGTDSSGQPTAFWSGLIDEVRIWDTARTPTQLADTMCQPLTGTEGSLLAYYRLDDDFNDLSGNGRHGSAFGNVSLASF